MFAGDSNMPRKKKGSSIKKKIRQLGDLVGVSTGLMPDPPPSPPPSPTWARRKNTRPRWPRARTPSPSPPSPPLTEEEDEEQGVRTVVGRTRSTAVGRTRSMTVGRTRSTTAVVSTRSTTVGSTRSTSRRMGGLRVCRLSLTQA